MASSIISLEILNYDFSYFPNIFQWLNNIKLNLTQFEEANKGLEEWRTILSSKERIFAEGIVCDDQATVLDEGDPDTMALRPSEMCQLQVPNSVNPAVSPRGSGIIGTI